MNNNILENDIRELKENVLDMWNLIISQLDNVRTALIEFDKNLANEVNAKEKRVDAYELKIDKECETFIALKNPVASDLRFALAVLKINNNLERIGDYANGISKIIDDFVEPIDEDLLNNLRIIEMFHICFAMLGDGLNSLVTEDGRLARTIFKMDKELNAINKATPALICELIKEHPDKTLALIQLLLIVRKLERVGDQITNIAEEIIFYVEAKKLMHKKLKTKLI